MHWLDPDYLPITTGVVERFVINPEGKIDGLLLTDQTLVHTPPRLSDQLKSAVRPGDSIRARGQAARCRSDRRRFGRIARRFGRYR